MSIVGALLVAGLAAVSAVPEYPQRIIGGSTTTINQYPYMAALLYSWNLSSYSQFCGGTILTSRSILSAAHCFDGDVAANWRIRVGSTWANSGGAVHNCGQIIQHSSYHRPNGFDHDIAILRTASAISFGTLVQQGRIAGYNPPDNAAVWAAGWGSTSVGGPQVEQLRHVQIWVVNQATCRSRYGAAGSTITDNMLCSGWLDVGGRDQCQGDSGGPLVHSGVVVGICSWGRGCALAQFPGVNTRVSRYTTWIQANV